MIGDHIRKSKREKPYVSATTGNRSPVTLDYTVRPLRSGSPPGGSVGRFGPQPPPSGQKIPSSFPINSRHTAGCLLRLSMLNIDMRETKPVCQSESKNCDHTTPKPDGRAVHSPNHLKGNKPAPVDLSEPTGKESTRTLRLSASETTRPDAEMSVGRRIHNSLC